PSELLNSLYQKNDLVHINLLRHAILFDQQNDEYEFNILENYYIGNYSQFVKDFNKTFPNLNSADNQLRFFYLASKFRLAEYSELKDIIPNINPETLSLENWRDFQRIKAVSYYWESNVRALNNSVAKVATDNRTNQVLLEYVNKVYQLQLAGQGALTTSGDVDVNYYLALNNLKAGKYDEAINFFDKASKGEYVTAIRKEFVDYGIGITQYASGNKEEAYKQMNIDYSVNELKESASFFKILIDFDDNKYGDVVSSSSEFMGVNSTTKYKNQLKYLQGASLYFLGNQQQAKKVLEEIKDYNVFVKYILADIYYEEGSYAKAKVFYKEARDNGTNNLSSFAGYGFAWSCFKLAQYKEAENAFEKSSLDSNFSEDLRFNMKIKSADSSYNSGAYRDAEKKYRELSNNLVSKMEVYKPLYKQSIYNLAKVYMKLKDFKKANEILERYTLEVKNDNETVIIKIIMANNLYQLKNFIDAEKIYEEIILTYKSYKDEDIYISLADCYFNDKEYAKALVVYQDYFREYSKGERDLDASYGMVQTLYQLKDYNSAKELAKQVDDKYGIGLLKELEAKIKFKKETASE
ncbi:MAG: CDC27 family protein, partial [Candidatus Riflemargulisbacteria bacterium]